MSSDKFCIGLYLDKLNRIILNRIIMNYEIHIMFLMFLKTTFNGNSF